MSFLLKAKRPIEETSVKLLYYFQKPGPFFRQLIKPLFKTLVLNFSNQPSYEFPQVEYIALLSLFHL